MKVKKTSLIIAVLPFLSLPVALWSQQAISVEPAGAEITANGRTMDVRSGMDVSSGGMVETNESTVVIARTNGSRVELAPDSRFEITPTGIDLKQGNATVTGPMGSQFDVSSEIGVVEGYGATFGVSLNLAGEMATLEISNVEGMVNFTADVDLDSTEVSATLIEPGKQVSVAPGDKLVIRVIYQEDREVYAIAPQGVAQEQVTPDMAEQITQTGDNISRISVPSVPDEAPEEVPTPADAEDSPVIIEIPVEDVEIASDPG